MEDCSKSWFSYGFAAVSGVLVLETFIIAAYCFIHQNGKRRKYKNRHTTHEETLPRYISSNDRKIRSETEEQTREQHKEHNQQNGHSNQITTTTDLPLVLTTPSAKAQEKNDIAGKKTDVSKSEKKKDRCQRIDPHHRSKQRVDIIRVNSISKDTEKENPLKNKDVINAKNENGVVLQGVVNKKSNKSQSGSQRGIMKSCEGSVHGKNDSLDSITGRPKKSVRFDLKRFTATDSDERSVPSTIKKSKISIISANKHDKDVKLMLKGQSDYADTGVPDGKRTFIVISDEEDEAGIVEIKPKASNSDNQVESSEKIKYTNIHQNNHKDMGEVNIRNESISKSSEDNVQMDSNSKQDDRNQHSPIEDKNGNIPNENKANNKIHPQNCMGITETSPGRIHSSEDTSTDNGQSMRVNILSTPQTVVLIENDKNEIASNDNKSTDKIPNSIDVRKTSNTPIRNVNNNFKKSVTTADNTRNQSVIIISSQDEDIVAQTIARGHVNSMIKMFQKIEGGNELTQEYNC